MPQFEGNKLKVRCADCSRLSVNHCVSKNTKVSPKKKRLCNVYEFKGEFENREPSESRYMPHMDRKTRRLIERLIKAGTLPVAEDGSVTLKGGFAKTKEVPLPSTTATASQLEIRPAAGPDAIVSTIPEQELADPRIKWAQDNEHSSE